MLVVGKADEFVHPMCELHCVSNQGPPASRDVISNVSPLTFLSNTLRASIPLTITSVAQGVATACRMRIIADDVPGTAGLQLSGKFTAKIRTLVGRALSPTAPARPPAQ
ncbi:hypothetical protein ETAA8_22780 [Anatilimnocola aggregata]|uniref:Uncharacterized protein n=1 Tax=Anatilimnocola aggregata TaxID=2528021 RepID=A0A517YAD1_9BACT|nr:hypothetical protein ETAA8_22780 [Anatilimnocola aggregata]